MTYLGRDHGDFGGMIGVRSRIPIMTPLKLFATVMVALLFGLLSMPSFAANGNDGATNPGDPTAKQRPHRKHGKHQHRHRRNPDGNRRHAPAPVGTDRG